MKQDPEAFPKFSEREFGRRTKALAELVGKASADSVIISGSVGSVANLYYWTNYLPRSSSYYVAARNEPHGALLVGSYNHILTARAMSVIADVRWATRAPAREILKELGSRSGGGKKKTRVAVIGSLPHDLYDAIRGKFDLVTLTRDANEIRAVKSPEEVDVMRRAAKFTDGAIEALEAELKPGMTEFDVANIVERSYVGEGGTTRIHYIVSTSMRDPDAYVPFQAQTKRKLRKGDIVLTEISAEYAGYAGQIHRPVAVAERPTAEYRRLFDVALSTYEEVRDALRDGARTREIVRATEGIVRAGYTICDSLVHGFGADLMFPDIGTPDSVYDNPDYVFKENMTVVIQPNPVTRDGKYGLQLGNLCLVRGSGAAESLQKFPLKFVTAG